MTQGISFTNEVKSDNLETAIDTLGVNVDTLESIVKEGFRRADVRHEDLCAKFNTLMDLLLHMNQKLDAQSGVLDQVKNHGVRIDLIELHLKKDA